MSFELDPRLAADTYPIGDLPLCRLLLMDDSRYPWCILVPRRADLREIHELDGDARLQLLEESALLSTALQRLFRPDKLNLAALGNLVPQLHLHHVVRYRSDPAWPAPVWGALERLPYPAAAARERVAELAGALSAAGCPPQPLPARP